MHCLQLLQQPIRPQCAHIAACLCNRRQAERATCAHMLLSGGRHMSIMDCIGISWKGP